MEIKKTWVASSKAKKNGEGKEFINIVGQWNVGVEMSFTNPCLYIQGPVEKVLAPKGSYRNKIGT